MVVYIALVDGIWVDDYYIVVDFCKPLLDSEEVVVRANCTVAVFHNVVVDAPDNLVVDLFDPVGHRREKVVAGNTFAEAVRPLAPKYDRRMRMA